MDNNKITDILESSLDRKIFDVLLKDKTTNENIIWATDDYEDFGENYKFHAQITKDAVTGNNESIIKPRADKEKSVQQLRSKEKAEVFTPAWVCNVQNNLIDNAWFGKEAKRFNTEKENSWETNYYKIKFPKDKSWEAYVLSNRLEVSCGEAPYIASRYDATTGKYIPVKKRIGLLDRKIRINSENTKTKKEWKKWTLKALQSIYGFDWQGDNILLARENLLYTVAESFYEKFKSNADSKFLLECAEIIAWNIWQMDGIKFVIPDSCHFEEQEQINLLGSFETKTECRGCKCNNPFEHNGIYPKIMDWETNRTVRFVDLIKGGKLYG